MPPVLILPGLGGSGPEHWQTLWEKANPAFVRVEQRDWDKPDREDWIATLDRAITAQPSPPILVAHSLSCALAAHWAAKHARPLHGALLVAPSDVESERHTPPEVRGFASRVEAYCRTLDAAVPVTHAFIDALHSEGSGDLAQRFPDQGHHTLRGRAEPIHLYGVKRSVGP